MENLAEGQRKQIECPVCNRKWDREGTEQAIAIINRGKCIVCIVGAKENIEMNPYEFQIKGKIYA